MQEMEEKDEKKAEKFLKHALWEWKSVLVSQTYIHVMVGIRETSN